MSDDPADELSRILEQTGSLEYARCVANYAADAITRFLLDDERTVIARVPVIAGRLATLIHHARITFALSTTE